MSFLVMEDEVSFINADSISLQQKLPIGIFKTSFNQFKGTYLEKTEIKLKHGQIFGNSQVIADHIVESYKMNDSDKNIGVLLSGGRGLGKTLTTRLVIEQLKENYPIIVISEFTPDLPDFLSHIKGCVILMDEFEKFMGGNIRGNDAENEQTKQESILSVLDGNTGNSGNLFLLTVNETYKLDNNLLSRPGRIRYHYKYASETASVIRDYCAVNLKNKDLTEDVVKTLGVTKYVSLDIITAMVDELNKFPKFTPKQVMEFLNVEKFDNEYIIKVAIKINGEEYTYSRKFDTYLSEDWLPITKRNEKAPRNICVNLDAEDIPSFIYSSHQLPVDSIEITGVNWDNNENVGVEDIEVLEVVIEDPNFKKYSRKFYKDSL